MKIGIDISQILYQGTGVARYVEELVVALIERDPSNSYVLFAGTFRNAPVFSSLLSRFSPEARARVTLKRFPFSPKLLDVLWNKLQIIPIEWLIGSVDVFWSSDWTQPPLTTARGVTTIHDLTIYRFPESFDGEIVAVHQRKLARSKAVCTAFFCDSEATKQDAMKFLGIAPEKLFVVYPGFSL